MFYDGNQNGRNKAQCKNEAASAPLANLVVFKL